jgi:hypothetical protein
MTWVKNLACPSPISQKISTETSVSSRTTSNTKGFQAILIEHFDSSRECLGLDSLTATTIDLIKHLEARHIGGLFFHQSLAMANGDWPLLARITVLTSAIARSNTIKTATAVKQVAVLKFVSSYSIRQPIFWPARTLDVLRELTISARTAPFAETYAPVSSSVKMRATSATGSSVPRMSRPMTR